ncbi:MAG: hemoglobin [Paraglaciecola sp.]|jgi:hemoglobin
MNMKSLLFLILPVILMSLAACTTTSNDSLYDQLGGQEKIEQVVDNFIHEIEFDAVIFEYFKNSDVERFYEKLVEHLCQLTGGPCDYTGDTMAQVHGGMNISEADFNRAVDLFINAMTKADIPHPQQNKVLAILVKTRKDMLYL